MKQTWDKFGNHIHNFKTELESLIEIVPQSGKIHKQVNRVNKAYNYLIKSAKDMDQFVAPVKSVQVDSPLLADADFKATWKFWKDYLHEQHGVIMRTRAELMALKRLMEFSGEKPATAIRYLEFAMGGLYANFFKVKETDNPETKNGEEKKMVVQVPSNYIPTPPVLKVKQKTIIEEIEEFQKNKRK